MKAGSGSNSVQRPEEVPDERPSDACCLWGLACQGFRQRLAGAVILPVPIGVSLSRALSGAHG